MALQLNQELQNKYPHLEVSVLKYSDAMKDNDSKRIDSEFFKKEYLDIENKIARKGFILFDEIIDFITDGKHGGVNFTESGVIFLKNANLKENLIDISDNCYISEEESNETKRAEVQPNDILLSTIGTVGLCAVVPKNFPRATINQNLVRIKLKEGNNPEFISIFLNSCFGRNQIIKMASGNVYFMINYPNLKKIKIPIFPLEFQQQIEEMVRESHECLEQSKGLYREAEVLLYRELGLDPENPLASIEPHSGSLNISVRPLSQSLNATGRLDSEYYQQKYDEIEKVIKNYRGGYVKIGDCFNQNKTTGNFILSKYNYIEIGDINIGTATADYHLIPTDELPANAKIFLCNGDLLVSKVRPNRGAVAIVNIDESNFIASGAFTVLQEKNEIKKEVLMILLRKPLYKEWLLKFNVGTSYPVIKDEDILNLIIPKIAQQRQTQIAEKIKQSFTLRKQANELLQQAKSKVETAIVQAA